MKINLKSERGATGTDVILAGAIILITMIVVSMIFVNTTLSTREVTRTSGATRIATNILGNIDEMTYEEYLSALSSCGYTADATTKIYTITGDSSGVSFFSTNIPKGYTVYFYEENCYGSYTNDYQQYDFVKSISVTVEYSVGDATDTVELSTVKAREFVDAFNEPDTSLALALTDSSGNVYKYACLVYYYDTGEDATTGYYKVSDSVTDYYDYSDDSTGGENEWATVLVSNTDVDSSGVIDDADFFNTSSGQLTATYGNFDLYVWVPRFLSSGSAFYAFAYSNTGYEISKETIYSGGDSTTQTKATYYTYSTATSTGAVDSDDNFGTNTGRWVQVWKGSSKSVGDVTTDTAGKKLNAKYTYTYHTPTS